MTTACQHLWAGLRRRVNVANPAMIMMIALAHAAAACAMAGVLWVVQLVVYPAFALVRRDDLPAYAAKHATRITPIVGPLMLVEAVAFVALVLLRAPLPVWLVVAGGTTLVVNWTSTFLWQVPLHGRLQSGDATAIMPLVRSNWLRTLCWTSRAVFGCLMVWSVAREGSLPS